jgi:Fe-S-cluster containining protein
MEKISALRTANPYQGERCSLLAANGECLIYEVRPIICRSHGAPVTYREGDVTRRDVCPLNFGGDTTGLDPEDSLNLDLLNTLLALIARQFSDDDDRTALKALP